MQGRKKKKMLVLSSSLKIPDPSPLLGGPGLLSTYLGIDSLCFLEGKKKGICCNKPLSKITDDINLILFFLFSNWRGIILMQDYFFFCCISGYNNITWIVTLTSGSIPLSVNNNKMRNNTQASKSFISML